MRYHHDKNVRQLATFTRPHEYYRVIYNDVEYLATSRSYALKSDTGETVINVKGPILVGRLHGNVVHGLDPSDSSLISDIDIAPCYFSSGADRLCKYAIYQSVQHCGFDMSKFQVEPQFDMSLLF
jgi:hypothetical protein